MREKEKNHPLKLSARSCANDVVPETQTPDGRSARISMSSTSSRPTRSISGGDIIVQVLADEGVDTVFGYSGGAILPTYDAVFRFNELARESGRREIQLIVRPANRALVSWRPAMPGRREKSASSW